MDGREQENMEEDKESGSEKSGSGESSWEDEVEDEEALWEAAREGDTDRVKQLLAEGVNPDATGPWEDTPLHDATRSGRPKCAEILLQHGADAGLRNEYGQTAEDIAADEDISNADPYNKDDEERITRGRKEILKLLRQQNNVSRFKTYMMQKS
ncbi:PREDICTED: tankyrase-2-like [Branchiostoma belcheri]|uniref:Tankyrase-2-like n=1 Tax=Branchiostoma belcheri TaxID=7741 RepID=A0A6P4YD30_BRABE|nr:PREDICTED: tankyrase-2-like [Branchiostoma belcheri]